MGVVLPTSTFVVKGTEENPGTFIVNTRENEQGERELIKYIGFNNNIVTAFEYSDSDQPVRKVQIEVEECDPLFKVFQSLMKEGRVIESIEKFEETSHIRISEGEKYIGYLCAENENAWAFDYTGEVFPTIILSAKNDSPIATAKEPFNITLGAFYKGFEHQDWAKGNIRKINAFTQQLSTLTIDDGILKKTLKNKSTAA